jgi:hypothetical protein
MVEVTVPFTIHRYDPTRAGKPVPAYYETTHWITTE